MPTTSISTTLLESVNIVLANLGESPVNTLSGGALPQQVSLALNTIEEVSTDIQSKGWWFNQKSGSSYSTTANVVIYPSNTGNNWGSDIPEEARRYITIRASRIAQTRLIGSEELQKFSYNEELVSLAILQQAHVRNSNGALDFNSFPSELRGLGMDEVMFLQGNVEEKIGTLRLGGELANTAKTKADTDLVEAQEELVDQQKLTEVQETAKRANEASLVEAQEDLLEAQTVTENEQAQKVEAETSLVEAQEELTDAQKTQSLTESILRSQQALTELEETAKRTSEKLLVDEQAGLVTNQAATELKKALDLVADTVIKGKQGNLIDKQALTEVENALKVASDTVLTSKQGVLLDKQAITEVENALKVAADASLTAKQGGLVDAQKSQTLTEALLRSQQSLTELEETSKRAAEKLLVDAQATDVAADTTLKGKQGSLVDAQATDVAADTTLKGKQGSLIDAQRTTENEQAQKVAAETDLTGKQSELTEAQTSGVLTDSLLKSQQALTELENTAKVIAETSLLGEQEDLVEAQALDVAADTTLKGKQGSLVDAQATDVAADTSLKGAQEDLVEAQTTDVAADTTLKGKQGSLVDAQATTEASQQGSLDAQATKFTGEGTLATNQAALVTAQKDQLLAQTAIEASAEKAFYDGVVAGTQDTYRDFAAEMRIMGVQETTFQQTPAYKKVEILKDADKLRLVTATETGTDATELSEVNKVMRFIGEPPVTALNDNSLASECVRLMRDTNIELQGRGWYFNIDEDGAIVPKALSDTPQKYREYLSVRVAILLTELYPQSGVDIQRLPKMEAELRAYFKDREFDDANYSIFDSYDVASRIGINRNYDLI